VSVYFCQTMWRSVPQDNHLCTRHHENLTFSHNNRALCLFNWYMKVTSLQASLNYSYLPLHSCFKNENMCHQMSFICSHGTANCYHLCGLLLTSPDRTEWRKLRRQKEFMLQIIISCIWSTVISWFMILIRSSKTVHKVKICKTKINFPLLPAGNNDRFARGRSSYKQKLSHKLKNRY
jgi:hypothetical protein